MKNAYAINWPEIAAKVKNVYNNTCEACHHKHDPKEGYTLTVHHIDGDTMNNQDWNLACLCQRCHLRYEHQIVFDQLLFSWCWPNHWLCKHLVGYMKWKVQRMKNHESATNSINNRAASAS